MDDKQTLMTLRQELVAIRSAVDIAIDRVDEAIGAEGDVTVPAEAIAKVDQEVCLYCGKPNKGRMTRGLHMTCYQFLRRQINSGKSSESDLIRDGLMLPAGKSGIRETEHSQIWEDYQANKSDLKKRAKELGEKRKSAKKKRQ